MAGQQQQGGGGGGGDNSLDFLWVIVMIVAGILAAWYFGRFYIGTAIFKVRYFEILLISYGLEMYGTVASYVGLPVPSTAGLIQSLNIISAGATSTMDFSPISQVSSLVGRYLAIPFAVVMGVLAFITIQTGIASRFKRVFNQRMSVLRESEKRLWKMIAPISKLELTKEDINKGPWAMSTPPMTFAKQNKLLKEDRSKRPVTVTIVRGAAARLFALQLGHYFTGVQALPMHIQALFAIFAARANRDRVNSDKLLAQLSESYAAGKLDFSGVKEVVAKYINTKEVQYVTRRHAYVLTMMSSMMELSRADGVLAVAEFLWLKPVDRRLWFMLGSIGRQTPFVEVSGPFAHWLVEKRLNAPMRTPMVDNAVKALESAVADVLYEPDEE
ncbi:MAG: type IVB secretion system coupling complex protein DotM/IcmP [Gammaproteobacteria bacterium]|nr:type IVB secretion system coupling complex protein DotM/IcmP [Gammaproteobacteria bacterium]